jgi:hypothetical protein
MIREPQGSSSSFPSSRREPSYSAGSAVLVGLWIFHIVNISWIPGLCSPGHFSVALSGFVSFGYSFAMIIIRQDVFFQFMKKFLNRLGFLSSQMRSCWSLGQTLDLRIDRFSFISFWDLGSLLHESSHKVPQ